MTPVGTLHVEKISELFFFYIFGIKVTASLFGDHGSLQFLLRWPQSIYQKKRSGAKMGSHFFPLLHRLHRGKTDDWPMMSRPPYVLNDSFVCYQDLSEYVGNLCRFYGGWAIIVTMQSYFWRILQHYPSHECPCICECPNSAENTRFTVTVIPQPPYWLHRFTRCHMKDNGHSYLFSTKTTFWKVSCYSGSWNWGLLMLFECWFNKNPSFNIYKTNLFWTSLSISP